VREIEIEIEIEIELQHCRAVVEREAVAARLAVYALANTRGVTWRSNMMQN
jgi:hypothetical protein